MRRFLLRLAGHLGMTVRDLEDTMDMRELLEWASIAKKGPLGIERLEWLIAQLCAMTYNAHRPKHARTASPDDYMPWMKAEPKDGGFGASQAAFAMLARKRG